MVNGDLPNFCCSFKLGNKKTFHLHFNNSTKINEKFVLACPHTGTGHSQLDSYLNIVSDPSITNQDFKGIERKVGKEIEQVKERKRVSKSRRKLKL